MPDRSTLKSFQYTVSVSLYLGLLVAYLVAARFPEYRIWGLNLWAYFPGWVPTAIFFVGLAVPFLLRYIDKSGTGQSDEIQADRPSDKRFMIFAFCSSVLLTLSFYFLRSRTFFLGDGYTNLSTLGADDPFVKMRAVGEALVHVWVKNLIGEGESAALLSFQIISIAAGIVFLVLITVCARLLFERTVNRILFFLWMVSGGYMLNYFGYAENYSLFVLTVTAYALAGLLIVQGKLNRWVALVLLVPAIFFHVFGVSLIPSAIYLLTTKTRFGERLAKVNRKIKVAITFFIVLVVTAIGYYFIATDYYFRFALVPIVADRFTVEGYTLFSVAHLLDLGNLLLLLVPSLLIVVVLMFSMPVRSLLRRQEYRHLLLLIVPTLGMAVIFDPKLGMPRDWDLFSFIGVPLALMGIYMILDNRSLIDRYKTLSLLGVALGFLALYPRATSQIIPKTSVALFNNYTSMDATKNMYGRTLLEKYYAAAGDSTEAARLQEKYKRDYPELLINQQGIELKKIGKCAEAVPYFKRALKLNPVFAAAYTNLGMCYMELNRSDLAVSVLEIARGLNPYNATIRTKLGGAYYDLKDYKKAEHSLRKAIELDPDNMDPLIGLVFVYKNLNRQEEWRKYLIQLGERDNAPLGALKDLGDLYLSEQQFRNATRIYEHAVKKGMDSLYYMGLKLQYPQLGQ
ncbi:MAG: tetratricopeptide repeat protein [candidate division Zixibacteria bacterium]|nr:tetratricopeptide repeat protein [candidate division Zixibacteria bacterium]